MESAGAGAGDGDFSALGWFPITLLCPTRTQLQVNLLPCRHPRGNTEPRAPLSKYQSIPLAMGGFSFQQLMLSLCRAVQRHCLHSHHQG